MLSFLHPLELHFIKNLEKGQRLKAQLVGRSLSVMKDPSLNHGSDISLFDYWSVI